jgi:hypothetical protein
MDQAAAERSAFSSSRMLPGHEWRSSMVMAARDTVGAGIPGRAFLCSSSSTSPGSSPRRARRGSTR